MLALFPLQGFVMAQSNVIDRVEWVVGDKSILRSDIEEAIRFWVASGRTFEGDPYCVAGEDLAVQQLFLHQAALDSIEVDEGNIMRQVEMQMEYVIQQIGSKEKMEEDFNMTSSDITESIQYFAKQIQQSQIIFIPGGFSGGDEPDGSGKFITAFFRNEAIKNEVNELLKNRDGLMCGICNGFQALIKLGLVPYGEIIDTDENCPTLTFNSIGRHQSRIVRTRIASNNSPWLSEVKVGDVYSVPISHGEGRFLCEDAVLRQLIDNGQIATQYVDLAGNATDDIRFNPNDSVAAIEGILSPDGRVIGKMGHAERKGYGLYKNVTGNFDMKLFESAVKYFSLNHC